MSQGAHAWTQRVGAFVALPQLIRQLGGDPAPVLAGAGLEPGALSHPDNKVPYAAFVNVLGLAAEITHCPHFGLLAGRMFRLSQLGTLGELMRHSATVGRALEALTVFQHMNSEGGLAFVLKRGDFVDLGYAMYHPSTSGAGQMYDGALAVVDEFHDGTVRTDVEALRGFPGAREAARHRAVPRVLQGRPALRLRVQCDQVSSQGPRSLRRGRGPARPTGRPSGWHDARDRRTSCSRSIAVCAA